MVGLMIDGCELIVCIKLSSTYQEEARREKEVIINEINLNVHLNGYIRIHYGWINLSFK